MGRVGKERDVMPKTPTTKKTFGFVLSFADKKKGKQKEEQFQVFCLVWRSRTESEKR